MAESHGQPGKASGTTAHTEAEGGHARTFPPFEKSTFASQLVSLLIAFVALYLIVSRIALPKVGGTIDARKNAIDGDLAEAQRMKDESDKALKAYEAELAASRAKAQAIGTEARDKFSAAAEQERKGLEEKLSAKLADAEKTIAATRQSAMSNVGAIANDAAAAIVQQLTGVAADAKAVASAVDASLKG